MTREVQIEVGTNAVWVNDQNGCCIGRFGRLGVDVHYTVDPETLEHVDKHGNPMHGVCADCAAVPGLEGWERFKASMLEVHDVVVTDDHKPEWV